MHVRSRLLLLRTEAIDGLPAYGSIDCGCYSDQITHLTSIALTAAALSAPHSNADGLTDNCRQALPTGIQIGHGKNVPIPVYRCRPI